jgi:drug/metabolite transporter (DMT)-like permease
MTVLAGFVGVVLMLKPTVSGNEGFAGLLGLLSGLTAAFAYMQVVALSRIGEPELRTVFYFAVGSAVAGAFATAATGFSGGSSWTWQHALWLLPIGLLAALGQLCMTRAYATPRPKPVRWWWPTCSTRASSSRRSTAWCCSTTASMRPAGPAWR